MLHWMLIAKEKPKGEGPQREAAQKPNFSPFEKNIFSPRFDRKAFYLFLRKTFQKVEP